MATVKDYRLKAGFSKSEFCKRADVDYATLTKAENGEDILEHNAQKIVNAINSINGTELEMKDIDGLKVYHRKPSQDK
jgi:predicted transcriptional regulator